MKPPVARKLASFLATGGFKFIIISKCMHGLEACLFKYITVAAFPIFAVPSEDGAKSGGWSMCMH